MEQNPAAFRGYPPPPDDMLAVASDLYRMADAMFAARAIKEKPTDDEAKK